jgi:hypothetical protein
MGGIVKGKDKISLTKKSQKGGYKAMPNSLKFWQKLLIVFVVVVIILVAFNFLAWMVVFIKKTFFLAISISIVLASLWHFRHKIMFWKGGD